MLKLLLLLPYLIVIGGHALVALALPSELKERSLQFGAIVGPMALYALGSLGGIAAVIGEAMHQPWAPWLAVTCALLICLGPLWYGAVVGEFHLSHHLVRAGLVAVSLVLYFVHVALHR